MKKFGNIFLKIIFGVFFIIFLITLMNGILNYEKIVYTFDPIKLVVCIVIYIIGMLVFYRKILDKLEKIKGIEYIFFITFSVIAVISAYFLMIKPNWDMGSALNVSRCYIEKGTYNGTYLSRCPNNIMMVFIECVIFKVSNLFFYQKYVEVMTIVGGIVVSLSVIISFYIVKKLFDRRKALLYISICLLTTPFYLYTAIYYTDIWSMVFCVSLLGYWLLLRDSKKTSEKVFRSIVFGIIFFISMKIKITAIFIFIAIILCEILRKNLKNIYKILILAFLTVIMLDVLFNNTIYKIFTDKNKIERYNLPFEHYFAIGLEGRGGFNQEAKDYTNSFKTQQEKKIANREKIKEILKSRNFVNHVKFYNRKIGYTWNDGTYYAPAKLNRDPVLSGILQKIVLSDGEYSRYYKYLPQTMHYTMMIFILINLAVKIRKKDCFESDTPLLVTVFGTLIFLIFWETRSRYLVTILPIMLMSQLNGIEYLNIFYEKVKNKIKKVS